MEYRVTFGQQYRSNRHPKVDYAHPDGWLTVMADNRQEAREKTFFELGAAWSFIYEVGEFSPEYYPKGELHRI